MGGKENTKSNEGMKSQRGRKAKERTTKGMTVRSNGQTNQPLYYRYKTIKIYYLNLAYIFRWFASDSRS